KKVLITHLKGNVREMTNIKGQVYGSSFIDSCCFPNNIFQVDTSTTNAYTGFRIICVYKKWKR
ncbi:MAG: hypothetical protein HYZ42_02845, partial [Bacteroidetes bacterium]|nr:hypothetical protein [Bacteroidota bacterium]